MSLAVLLRALTFGKILAEKIGVLPPNKFPGAKLLKSRSENPSAGALDRRKNAQANTFHRWRFPFRKQKPWQKGLTSTGCGSELHRLRAVFLATLGAEEIQIELSFCEAIRLAKQQNSISLATRAEASYADYYRQKASRSRGRGF